MPISRSQMPRQMYGLGSFVKSIGKGIKKIVKSPIGKAAILGFGANALMPGGLSSLFGSGSFNPLLRKTLGGDFAQSQFGSLLSGAKNFLGSNVGKFVAGATAGKLFGGMEDQQIEELKANPEALANYLRQYYSNLNQTAKPEEVEEFVQRNMQANGGRMGYADGTEKIVQPSASMMVDTTTSNPIPNDAPQKEISEVAKIMLGPGRSGIGEPENGTMKGYQFFRTQYLPKKVKEISENFGIEESDVLRLIREEMMNYIDTPKSLEKPKMAYGGRIGYANGMEPFPYVTKNGLRGIDFENLSDAQKQLLKNMKQMEDRQQESLMKKIKKLREGMPENERNMKPVPIRKIGPEGISGMAYGGRIKRAYGSDDLVEQASGIEGLDININPKGVKELDLRETGGFIPPVGVKEKADDIPAMLSNNEFVFTADAVRAAGGGSVNKGAQIMYDTMKKLENGGTV
ncbi:hypothetical protein OAH93_00875 [Flavobacteriales bacterium]|nr:hypothetical protein [Porticoccaceae bacterium]MDB4676176.1 hypothetical protein [Flavobacteriales bacterium]